MQRKGEKLHLNNDVRQVIDSCKKGDRAAQRVLYNSLAKKMFALCLRYMGDRSLAEDILQEGFITLFSNIGKYKEEGSFEGWARKIFVNTALMSLRKTDALKLSEDITAAKDIQSENSSQIQSLGYQELMRMITALPPGYRTVFNLSVIEGYSHKEIAEILSISEVTSRSQLQRARKILQDKIINETNGKE